MKHSTILIASFMVTSGLNYAFGVILSWFFSPAEFGVLGVAQSLLLLAALAVGSGFAWTTAHDIAASGVTDETRHRFRAALVANIALGALLAGGLWAAYAMGWLPLGPIYRTVVPLVGLTIILLAARSVVNGAARGLYRFGPVAVNLASEVAIKAAGGLALVVTTAAGVTGVMVGFAVGAAAALGHSLWAVRPAQLWGGQGWFDGRVVTTTVPLFAGMLGPALILNLDVLGLKFLAPAGLGDELTGFYQAAVILARTPVFIAQSLNLVLFSYVAGAKGSADRAGMQPCLYTQAAVRTWAMILLPIGLLLALAPRATLTIFFPARYQAAEPALRVAAGGGVLLALVTLLNGVFLAAGDRRRPAVAAGLAVIAQAITLVWLVPRWTAVGAALSLLVAAAVALCGLAPRSGRLLSAWPRDRIQTRAYQVALPVLALATPLLLLPDGGRGAAALKLGLAGLAYLIALIGSHFSAFTFHRPGTDTDWGAAHPFIQVIHILVKG